MKYLHVIYSILILGMTSCIPYQEIDIQYLNKPEINILSDFSKPIILVNFYNNSKLNAQSKFEYAIDSVAAEEASQSLKENLNNSPLFDSLDIPIRKFYRSDSSKYVKPLTWSIINNIANENNADLIISLEYIKIIESSDSYRTQSNDVEYYYGYLRAPIYCYWRVYDVLKKQILNGYLYRDTLLWDAKDWTPVSLGNQIPGYFTASAFAGNECGEKYAVKIAPIWNNDKRILFHKGSKEMEKAAILAINGEWIDAATVWQEVLTFNKRRTSAKASFNLALASEMLGKFDLAQEWLRKAKKLYPLPEIESYRKTIEKRINNSFK